MQISPMYNNKSNKQKKFCTHESKDQIIDSNHEICCTKCGTVLGTDNEQEYETVNTVNLFQEVQPGTKPVKMESTTRIHEPKYISSAFSNACDKLNLPRHVAIDAYRTFIKIRKINTIQKKSTKIRFATNSNEFKIHNLLQGKIDELIDIDEMMDKTIRISNFEIAMYSLFVSIRRFGMLISIAEIESAIKFAFSVKRTVCIIKVFSDVKPIARELGINYDDEDHLEYWINIHLRNSQHRVNFFTNEIKEEARKTAKTIIGTDEFRARLAVKNVLAKLGVKIV